MRLVRYSDGTVRVGILADDGTIQPVLGGLFDGLAPWGAPTHVEKVQLLSPLDPRSIIGVGLNYVKHAREVNKPLPVVPMLFMKPVGATVGPETPIVLPREGGIVHFEAEVAVVIGRVARRISEEEAPAHILGVTCGNDVSERVIQGKEMDQGTLLIGKAYDSFNPLGPAIVTGLDPDDIDIIGRVNGEVRQRSNTSDLVYSIPKLVSYISQAFTLFPGDVIMTGTPEGVGPISDGDVVEIEIPQVGVLRNPVIAEA
jgi:2-keto-4-pentenoate hydratase/2-oxohepta-3-ene-1,7-dioic acid hydratase in catechol pathway